MYSVLPHRGLRSQDAAKDWKPAANRSRRLDQVLEVPCFVTAVETFMIGCFVPAVPPQIVRRQVARGSKDTSAAAIVLQDCAVLIAEQDQTEAGSSLATPPRSSRGRVVSGGSGTSGGALQARTSLAELNGEVSPGAGSKARTSIGGEGVADRENVQP